MDVNKIIVAISSIILIAYVLEQISRKVKLPSVILLLVFGIILQKTAVWLHFELPFVAVLLPALGTIGLILIVLEGALDLELSRKKKKIIRLTLFSSTLGMLLTAFGLGFLIQWYTSAPFQTSLVNALPLAVISSAVAIPSARLLTRSQREFVTYESSFSDIIGVLFFSLLTGESGLTGTAISAFGLMFILTCLTAVIVSLLLVWYLDKVEHHVKFLPIFSVLLLLYGVAKIYHSSPLIIALLFGLALNNTHLFIKGRLTKFFRSTTLVADLVHFRGISAEAVFLIKAFFFILFGFAIDLHLLTEWSNLKLALISVGVIIALRFAVIKVFAGNYKAIVYFAPRGLITLLLFLSIPESHRIIQINEGVVTIIVLMTILFMLPGSWQKTKVGIQ